MISEILNICGVAVPHTVVRIVGDGACLFRAVSYILYGNELLARETREQIVDYVVDNWSDFAVMSHNSNGDNYSSSDVYFADMSLLHTYGGLCELAAAGQIFDHVFEVYRNGDLYVKFGTEGRPIGRLRFTSDLSSGHFDVYVPYEVVDQSPTFTQFYTLDQTCIAEHNVLPILSTIEVLNICGVAVPHTVVRTVGDGACLFRAISYILYGNELLARETREQIVDYVVENWSEFAVMSHNSDGDNYGSSDAYFIDMSLPQTFGGLCELAAGAHIFGHVFEVYRNGDLYVKFGTEGSPIGRLRFSSDLSSGHFDVYVPYEVVNESPTFTQSNIFEQTSNAPDISPTFTLVPNPEISTECSKQGQNQNYRSRCTQRTRAEQLRDAKNKYIQNSKSKQDSNKSKKNQSVSWRAKANSGTLYDHNIDYAHDRAVVLGTMNLTCKYCGALKWRDEAPGMCCGAGKVQLSPLKDLPDPLYSLIIDMHPDHSHFFNNVRNYNGCFQMTSFGAKQIRDNGFMPTFKVQGQVYHRIGSLLPVAQQESKFLQIYFVGEDEAEAKLRCRNFTGVKHHLVKSLQKMLHEHNCYVKDFKTAMEKMPANSGNYQVVIHADRKPVEGHIGCFNAPSVNEIGIVIAGQEFENRDIVLQSHDNKLQRISEVHRSYDALQYPLLFCHGEDGYSIDIPQHDPITKNEIPKKTVSAASFYSFRLMIRKNALNHLVYFRSLFSQFLVDMYAKVESERLNYLRRNQTKLRVDSYIHLRDAVGGQDANQLGQMVVLPSSFTGGPRYMHEKTQDAMTYVRHYGKPDLFITFTCNPRWHDIIDVLLPGQMPHDRHDIIARVFHLKVKKIMALINKENLFGDVRCYMFSVEWQKRGLPHVHILLWLRQHISPTNIDSLICAEIPDPNKDPELNEIVKSNMIHGPCGSINHNSPCMKEGKCSKQYPRALLNDTQSGEDGYPQYRRRSASDGGFTVNVRGVELDNRWVVPYNPVLLRTFNAHINVEYCNSVKSIKYICKYVNKGSDQACFSIENKKDEIKQYESGRYISSSEAVWRILGFSIHERYPSVFHLDVHLENGQRVYFTTDTLANRLDSPPKTTLLGFFELCQTDSFAKTLLYCDIPAYYVWKNKKFERRKRGSEVPNWPDIKKDSTLGRVYTIHPNNAECYYLRLLLHEVRGPTSFSYLKTINGVIYPTYHAACQALGLLENDEHWNISLTEAALSDSPHKLRELFTILLVFCQLSDPLSLWENHKISLSEDFRYELERRMENANTEYLNSVAYDKCLSIIEEEVRALGGCSLLEYGLPQPNRVIALENRDLIREISYDTMALESLITTNIGSLTYEQKYIYDLINASVEADMGNLLFLDAPGGTGKTYLINLLLAKVRSKRNIALAVASSGIAATLLEGGKTAHAAFKLPLNLTRQEFPLCNITKQSRIAEVLRQTKLIVWDEASMAHKAGVEALNRTLKDIRGNCMLMGGVTVLLAGDFRQTLPVIPRGTRADEVNACLKRSYLWPEVTKLRLTKNMRVYLGNDPSSGQFSELLLEIGHGNIPEFDGKIAIPTELCTVVTSLDELVLKIYPDVVNIQNKPMNWLCERAILTPKNDQAAAINNILLKSFTGAEMVYRSVDTALNKDDAVHYPVEFLNTLKPPGFPEHKLILRVGAPVMLLRNLRPPKLCNGTRLKIKALNPNTIEGIILTGCAQGESVFIPRIPLIPNDSLIEFKRLQFPIKVCFAMTINKSQGQSLKLAGVDLREDCFSHGQFYVACSRVSSRNNLVILVPSHKRVKNIVYKEVL